MQSAINRRQERLNNSELLAYLEERILATGDDKTQPEDRKVFEEVVIKKQATQQTYANGKQYGQQSLRYCVPKHTTRTKKSPAPCSVPDRQLCFRDLLQTSLGQKISL